MPTERAGLVIVAAGTGSRLGAARHKALVRLGGRPLLEHALLRLLKLPWLDPVVLVVHAEDRAEVEALAAHWPRPVSLVAGGARRQDSVQAGLRALGDDAPPIVLVHDAARPFVPVDALAALADAAAAHGAALLTQPLADTIKQVRGARVETTLPREALHAAQTPQAFRRRELLERLQRAQAEGRTVTDEAALYEADGAPIACVPGSARNFKITTPADLALAQATLQAGSGTGDRPMGRLAVGLGFDVHRTGAQRPLVLGGLTLPDERGLVAHSDGDVLLHAILDALLSAAGLPDLGSLYPDSDPRHAGASSLAMARDVAGRLAAAGVRVLNVDAIVLAEAPKIAPLRARLGASIADALGLEPGQVAVKGKTFERLGPVGEGAAIEVRAVALVERAG